MLNFLKDMGATDKNDQRIFGLDLIRAFAVLAVVFHHSFGFIRPPAWLAPWGAMGDMAVEWFFVLSGFLIGGSLLREVTADRFDSLSSVKRFLAKRWLRTLPLYYAFLIYSFVSCPKSAAMISQAISSLFLMQNFAWRMSGFYFQSWTLTILELFYLSFTVSLVFSSRWIKNKLLSFLFPLALFVIVPLLLRAIFTTLENPVDFDQILRRQVVFRLDAPVAGILMAVLHKECPAVWSRLYRYRWLSLFLLAGLIGYYLAGLPFLFQHHGLQIIFLPLVSMICALSLPFFHSWKESPFLWGKGVGFVSTLSYSIYLSHVWALAIGASLIIYFAIPPNAYFCIYAIFYAVVFAVAYLGYIIIERPFLKFRGKNRETVSPASASAALEVSPRLGELA